MILAANSFLHFLFGFLMIAISLFLILLVLVQRGRGGGLTGALGGMGGQSAFGTKAGDTFTRITYISAIIWIVICMLAIKVLHVEGFGAGGPSRATLEDTGKAEPGTTKTPAPGTSKAEAEAPVPDAPAPTGKSESTDK